MLFHLTQILPQPKLPKLNLPNFDSEVADKPPAYEDLKFHSPPPKYESIVHSTVAPNDVSDTKYDISFLWKLTKLCHKDFLFLPLKLLHFNNCVHFHLSNSCIQFWKIFSKTTITTTEHKHVDNHVSKPCKNHVWVQKLRLNKRKTKFRFREIGWYLSSWFELVSQCMLLPCCERSNIEIFNLRDCSDQLYNLI